MNCYRYYIRACSLLLFAFYTSVSHASDYLPWQLGDLATFQTEGAGHEIIIAPQPANGGWSEYNNFAGLGHLLVLAKERHEQVYLKQEGNTRRQLFVNFAAALGASTSIRIDPCNNGLVVIGNKSEQLVTPAGTFNEVIRLDLTSNCADGGVNAAWFARSVGLVQWQQNSIAGPVVYKLVRARIGGVVLPAPATRQGVDITTRFPEPQVWIDVFPGPSTQLRKTVEVAMEVHNHTSEELRYEFRSSQRFDISILDAAGKTVSAWSRGKSFSDVMGTLIIPAAGSQRFGGEVDLSDEAGQPLAAGGYTLKIELTSMSADGSSHSLGSARLSATTPLEIRWAQ